MYIVYNFSDMTDKYIIYSDYNNYANWNYRYIYWESLKILKSCTFPWKFVGESIEVDK